MDKAEAGSRDGGFVDNRLRPNVDAESYVENLEAYVDERMWK